MKIDNVCCIWARIQSTVKSICWAIQSNSRRMHWIFVWHLHQRLSSTIHQVLH
jgi:hypothetical protein